MAAKQLQDLKLSEEQAEQIIELGISFGAYDGDEIPDSKKEKINAATEIVAHSLDAWIEDEIRPDDEEADVAEAGAQIEKVFAVAGITVDDGEVSIGGDGSNGDGEAPFDPDDYIEGYSELSPITKLARVKKLDPENDDDAAVLEAIAEWENEQEKPSSRVLNYIDETLPQDNGDETADQAGDGGSASEEPWDGYDKMTATQVKQVLKEASEDEDDPLTVDQVEYVLDYEQNREKPAPRKRVIDYCKALLEEMQGEGGGEPEPEAEPEKPRRGRGRGKREEEPVASNGVIVLTRDDILVALADGKVEIEV